MRVLLLSDSNSPHTIKWVESLRKNLSSLAVFSIHEYDIMLYKNFPDVFLYSGSVARNTQLGKENSFLKFFYFKTFFELKKTILAFKPDIVHAHYATSYGLLGVLSGFHPLIISVWGSDVQRFPKYSILHKLLLKFILFKADYLNATSNALMMETNKYTTKKISIIPFGIDIERFRPREKSNHVSNDPIIIGNIKSLELNYGIDFLIKAFARVKKLTVDKKIKLIIVGQGSQEKKFKKLVYELGIENETDFTGYINHKEIHKYFNNLDINVTPSIEESFGVSVLEASACGKPVIVTNVGGLPEVVEDKVTGFIVEKENVEAIVNALIILISDGELRSRLGANGRRKVVSEFNWESSVSKTLDLYSEVNYKKSI